MVPGNDNLVFRGNTGGGNHRSARRKVFTQTFIAGAQNLLGVGLIIGIARGATLILDKGEISGTILHYLSGRVEHVPRRRVHRRAFLRLRRIIDLHPIGVSREEIVNAYCYGMGLMGFIAPTGLV